MCVPRGRACQSDGIVIHAMVKWPYSDALGDLLHVLCVAAHKTVKLHVKGVILCASNAETCHQLNIENACMSAENDEDYHVDLEKRFSRG